MNITDLEYDRAIRLRDEKVSEFNTWRLSLPPAEREAVGQAAYRIAKIFAADVLRCEAGGCSSAAPMEHVMDQAGIISLESVEIIKRTLLGRPN